jgi:phenylpropionate dioxygenase-like ring-hydroxylating dioxygenase large terminal subunit
MRTLIPPALYFREDAFASEREQLLPRAWHFACLSGEVRADKDFVSMELFGVPVFVQNFNGRIRAFTNVCPHRFSKIKTEPSGNGMPVCPYHGWSFNRDGVAVGIARKSGFEEFKGECPELPRLEEWSVEVCGQFVFVRRQSDSRPGGSLQEFLGGHWDDLLLISSSMGPEISVSQMNIAANWKICVENTLENYHVDLIHPESFKKLGAVDAGFTFGSGHSQWRAELSAKTMAGWKRMEKAFATRRLHEPGYRHFFIFPNLTVATTYGATFSVQRFEPRSAGMTAFETRVYMAELGDDAGRSSPFYEMMREAVPQFNAAVFAEDKLICEHVHEGTKAAGRPGFLSDIESRVGDFQRSYMEMLK